MATWNMGQYDSIENDARLMDEIEYTRQRQDVLDKRAAQDYALKRKDDLRKAELAKVNHDYTMRNVSNIQKLADMKRQNELNTLEAAQQKHDINTALHNDKMLHLGEELELARLKRQRDINNHKIDAKKQGYTLQNFDRTAADAERARKDKEDQIAYSRRTYSPYQEAVLKLKASGGNVNALTDAEKSAIEQEAEKEYQLYSTLVPFATKEFSPKSVQNFLEDRRADAAKNQFYDDLISSTPEQLEAKTGINPRFINLYAAEQRAAAAKNAEYQRKNAPAAAKAQQEQVYKSVSAEIASLYNAAVNRGEIDPQKTKSKDTIDHASQIYINALKSGKQITYQQAVEQAAGIKPKTMPRSNLEWIKQLDTLYGGKFRNLKNEKQEEVIDKAKEFEKEVLEMLQTRGIQSWGELPLDELRLLDRVWQNSINDDDLYSPFQNQIFLRERDDLYAQKFPLIKELRQLEAENTMDYYDVNSNIRVSYNHELAKKVDRLKTQIANINDAIKMREKKLSARGIKFKEYK